MSMVATASASSSSGKDDELGSFAVDHICFVKLEQIKAGIADNATTATPTAVLWPALAFDNYAAMKSFVDCRGILPKTEQASITLKLMHDIRARKCGNDPVALLLGRNNPTGERCIFNPTNKVDYFEAFIEVQDTEDSDLKESLAVVEAIVSADAAMDSPSDVATMNDEALSVSHQSVASNNTESRPEKSIPRSSKQPLNSTKTKSKPAASTKVRSVNETSSSSSTVPPPSQAFAPLESPAEDTLSFVGTDGSMTSPEPETAEKHAKPRSEPAVARTVAAVAADDNLSFVGSDDTSKASPESSPAETASPEPSPAETASPEPAETAKRSSKPAKRKRGRPSQEPNAKSKKRSARNRSVSFSGELSLTDDVEPKRQRVTQATKKTKKQKPVKAKAQVQKPKRVAAAAAVKAKRRSRGATTATSRTTAKAKKRKAPKSTAKGDAPQASSGKRAKSAKAKQVQAKPMDFSTPKEKTSIPRFQKGKVNNETKAQTIHDTPPSTRLLGSSGASPDLSTTSSTSSQSTTSSASLLPAKLPSFNEVQPLLKRCGFKFPNGRFILPGVDPSKDEFEEDRDYFSSASRLRRYLCAYGLDCQGFEWSDAEYECLSLWIRTAIVPGLWFEKRIPDECRVLLRAVHGVLMKLGFTYKSDGTYYLPGVKPKIAAGLSMNGRMMLGENGLLVYLARFGLPENCTFGNLAIHERNRLEYHISQIVTIPLKRVHPKADDPPIFNDGESQTLESAKSNGSGSSSIGERDEVEPLQTQNASPSCRSTAGATVVTSSTEEREDLATDADNQSKVAESHHFEAQSPLQENAVDEDTVDQAASFPFTQPEEDSSVGSAESDDLGGGKGISTCSGCTQETADLVERTLGPFPEDESSPHKSVKLFAETPDRDAASTGDAAESEDPGVASDDSNEETTKVTTSPPEPAFRQEIHEMFEASQDRGSPGSDCIENIIGGSESPRASSPTDESALAAAGHRKSQGGSENVAVGMGSECVVGAEDAFDIKEAAIVRMPIVQVEKNDDWNTVHAKLKMLGWTHSNGKGLVTDFFLPPGGKLPSAGGRLNEDYVEELVGMKKFAYERLGWAGDEAFLVELENSLSRNNTPEGTRSLRKHSRTRASPRNRNNGEVTTSARRTLKEQSMLESNDDRRRTRSVDDDRSSANASSSSAGVSEGRTRKGATRAPTSQTKRLRSGHPDLKRTAGEKLKACQAALGTSFNIKTLSAAGDGEENGQTVFQANVDRLHSFIQATVNSEGMHGEGAGDPACLYLCGAPGVGKTSAVKYAIKETERLASENQNIANMLLPSFCFVNAADVISPKAISEKIADALKLKGQRRTIEQVRKALDSSQSAKRASSCSCIILIIDEIELLLSERGKTSDIPTSNGEEALKMLGEWASDQNFTFALIGISNSIGNQQAKRLQKFGLAHNVLTFSPYRKEDLVQIVQDRIGNNIVDPKAVEFAASKVSANSGDARKVLELTSSAIAKCLSSLSPEERKETTMDKPIVALKFMLKAVKETIQKHADIIEGLPQVAKIILCVAVSLNQVGRAAENMTLGMLKKYVFQSLDKDLYDEDELSIDNFSSLVQQLFDAGLLLSGTAEPFDVSAHGFASLYAMPIRVGVQLHDVESALEETLGDQELYRGVMERARRAKW